MNDYYKYVPALGAASPSTAALPTSLTATQNVTATMEQKFTISGTVGTPSGLPITTIIGALDGNREPPSQKNGWNQAQAAAAGSVQPFEIPKYFFTTQAVGAYTITVGFPGNYGIVPSSNGIDYPQGFVYKNVPVYQNLSGINFIGYSKPITITPPAPDDPPPPDSLFTQYVLSGQVVDAWTEEGLTGIPVYAIEKRLYVSLNDRPNQTDVVTTTGGIYVFDALYPGQYLISPNPYEIPVDKDGKSLGTEKKWIPIDYFTHPDQPYRVSLFDRNITGLDFQFLKKIQITGQVRLIDVSGLPIAGIPDVSFLVNTGHAQVVETDSTFSGIWNYDDNLFYPHVVENYDATMTIADRNKHNVRVINNSGITTTIYGDQIDSGNAAPGKAGVAIGELAYPTHAVKLTNNHLLISEFGGQKITELKDTYPVWNEASVVKIFSLLERAIFTKYYNNVNYSAAFLANVTDLGTTLRENNSSVYSLLASLYDPYADYGEYYVLGALKAELEDVAVTESSKTITVKRNIPLKQSSYYFGVDKATDIYSFLNTFDTSKLLWLDLLVVPTYLNTEALLSLTLKDLKVLLQSRWTILKASNGNIIIAD